MGKTTTITVDKDSKELLNQVKHEVLMRFKIPITNRILFDYMVKYVHINKEDFLNRLTILDEALLKLEVDP